MPVIHHDKLVRDKIPEIISAAGKKPVTSLLSPEEMSSALDAKLSEEVREFQESHSVEEMADVLEVLRGIAFWKDIPWSDVEDVCSRKREERGGFEKGIQLIEVRSE